MTAGLAAGAALAMYVAGTLRRDVEIDRRNGAEGFVSVLAAALSVGCVAFALRNHEFHASEAAAVAITWGLCGPVWRGAMGRWRHAMGALLASSSLAMASYWYVDRGSTEWLLTAILVASYLAVIDMLALPFVIGLLALAWVHAPDAIHEPGFFSGLIAACIPGAMTWLAMFSWRASRRTAESGPPSEVPAQAMPGFSRHLRRIQFEFGFLGAAAMIVGIPFMTNQVWPMAGVEIGHWLAMGITAAAAGIYNLMTRPAPKSASMADLRSILFQLLMLAFISPIVLGMSFSRRGEWDGLVYLSLISMAGITGLIGLSLRPRNTPVPTNDIRMIGLHLLLVFPMAYGWTWMIKGIRSDAQWWVVFLLPMLAWVSRGREPATGRA